MPIRDQYNMPLSAASGFAADNYTKALNAYHCYAGDPATLLQTACADSPGFVMGYVLTAYLTLIGSNAEMQAMGVQAYQTALHLPATARERGHVAAVGHLIAGEYRAAGRILEDLAIENPRDALALQVGQLIDFSIGDTRMLRDRIARSLPSWSRDMPDYHALLGMLAFGLEEAGDYDLAEAAGREAIDLEPRNGWAWHAVTHVLEMQGRRNEGVAFLLSDINAWSHESFFQVHNWWHLALFYIGLGEADKALALYDGPINGGRSNIALDLVDASALLWRIHLQGIDVGDRWAALAGLWSAASKGEYAFDDAHAMMAFVGGGQLPAARALLACQQSAVNDNAGFVAEVGLPLMQALLAFGEQRYAVATELLREMRSRSVRFGGSHAQRDIIDLTLIEAASRAGQHQFATALRAERAIVLPTSRAGHQDLAA